MPQAHIVVDDSFVVIDRGTHNLPGWEMVASTLERDGAFVWAHRG